MEATEIRKLTELEDTHWWYRERRAILSRELSKLGVTPGRALDVGAAGGGNTRVLKAEGWDALAVEYSEEGVEVARERGLNVIQADARDLPLEESSFDLVVAFDVLEHIEEDDQAASEFHRVIKPGGHALIAVPCDMRLWSAHDVAVGHVRRYEKDELIALMTKAGFVVDDVWSWNVLLRPVAVARRKKSSGSDLSELNSFVNFGLSMIIASERYLPVRGRQGVSLVLRASKPA